MPILECRRNRVQPWDVDQAQGLILRDLEGLKDERLEGVGVSASRERRDTLYVEVTGVPDKIVDYVFGRVRQVLEKQGYTNASRN